MKKTIILLIFALLLTACTESSSADVESAEALESTLVAELVSLTQTAIAKNTITTPTITPTAETQPAASLSSEFENAAPILTQLIIGVYQLEDTDQAITSEQTTSLLPYLTSLQEMVASTTLQIRSEQPSETPEATDSTTEIDLLVDNAMTVFSNEQIQAIDAMQITQEIALAKMEELGISMSGPGQGDSNRGQPPQGEGEPPQGGSTPGEGGQPPDAGQMDPPTDGMQPASNLISPELIETIIQFLQAKITSG